MRTSPERRAAIQYTMAKGNTSLYNGLYLTLKELMKQRTSADSGRRQAIVVLTDDDDTTSLVSYDDATMHSAASRSASSARASEHARVPDTLPGKAPSPATELH